MPERRCVNKGNGPGADCDIPSDSVDRCEVVARDAASRCCTFSAVCQLLQTACCCNNKRFLPSAIAVAFVSMKAMLIGSARVS